MLSAYKCVDLYSTFFGMKTRGHSEVLEPMDPFGPFFWLSEVEASWSRNLVSGHHVLLVMFVEQPD